MKRSVLNSHLAVIISLLLSINVFSQSINLQLQSDYGVGPSNASPRVAVGDVNSDGRPDLVTLNPNNLSSIGPISVFLNIGTGGFGSALNTPNVSLSPTAVVIRDFNGDGNADLAISQTGIADGINIRLGNGTGNYLTGTSIAAERGSPVIATDDLNGDGHADLAICNNLNELRILNGTGAGSFGAATPFTTAGVCQDLEIADFDADGRPDVAVAMRLAASDRAIQIFLNNGAGFNSPINVSGAVGATELAIADLNRDCIPDIVAAQFAGSVTGTPIFVLLGNGSGSFTSAPTVTVNNFPRHMAVGDFNLDKKVDIAIRRNINNAPTANNLTILPGNGSGGFGAPFEASIATPPSSTEMQIVTLDADNDGKHDVVIGRQGGFLLYHGSSPFFTRTESDYDGDRRADLAVFRPSLGDWFIDRSLHGSSQTHWGSPTDTLTPADFDGDFKTDIAIWRPGNPSEAAFWILQSSDNTVRVAQFGRSGDDTSVVADWDGDGKADPAVYRDGGPGLQSFFYYRGSLNNPLGHITYLPWGIGSDQAVRGDFDGDGKADAGIFRPSNAIWYILQSSNGQVHYQYWGLANDKRVAGDFDADGKTDFVVFRPSNNFWYILNSSTGSASYAQWGATGDSLVPGDYNGDGKSEFAVYRPSEQRWYVPQCGLSKRVIKKFGSSGDSAVSAVP